MEINTSTGHQETTRFKFLILRFSSFGDVTQCLSVPSKLAEKFPNCEIHWAIREDLAPLLQDHPHIQKVWTLSRRSGLQEILKLGQQLANQNYTHVYDAHNSTRSWTLSLYLKARAPRFQFIRKSQKRWHRFLLFKFHITKYRMHRSGQRDLLEPLQKGVSRKVYPRHLSFFCNRMNYSPCRT